MLGAAAIRSDGLPRGGLIEMREERSRQRDGVGIDLRLGGGCNQRACVGDDGGAARIEEILQARSRLGIQREGSAALRSLGHDGQQFAQGIGQPRRA